MTTQTIRKESVGEHFACAIEKRSDGKYSVVSIFKGVTNHLLESDDLIRAVCYLDGLVDGFSIADKL